VIVLTADQDWAPAWATTELCQKWVEAGQHGTLFVTHQCASLASLRAAGAVELGWHPNFRSGSTHGATEAEVLGTLARLVPEAAGVRAHGLMTSTRLASEYARRGLIYESSYLLEGAAGLAPVVNWDGLVRLPIYWEDDVHMLHEKIFRLDKPGLERPGLKVFNFHPVHVALNSGSPHGYERLKALLERTGRPMAEATPEDRDACRGPGLRGVRDLLDDLLEWLSRHPERGADTMCQIAEQARVAAGWSEA
jgi:hypothetical protein